MESVPNDLTAGPSPDASGAAGGEFKAGKAELSSPRAQQLDVPSRQPATRASSAPMAVVPTPPVPSQRRPYRPRLRRASSLSSSSDPSRTLAARAFAAAYGSRRRPGRQASATSDGSSSSRGANDWGGWVVREESKEEKGGKEEKKEEIKKGKEATTIGDSAAAVVVQHHDMPRRRRTATGSEPWVPDRLQLTESIQNWDAEFQLALEQENWEKLHQISVDFVEAARLYGKIVILEQFLPDEQRTIKVERVGGMAGGTKFIVRGIMFKLAEDPVISTRDGKCYLYGGNLGPNHEFAAKSANHELRGADQIFRAGWERLTVGSSGSRRRAAALGLRVPMMVLIDYCGFRVTARPWVSLGEDSMLYGYDGTSRQMLDAKGWPQVRNLMRDCAERLHLAPHLVYGKVVYSGGDVEVHRGQGGRLYVLDATRMFPCESSEIASHLKRVGQPEFFRMLRPELLQQLRARGSPALSPDGFTGFSEGDPDALEHMRRIEDATQTLLHNIIPAAAAELDQGGRLDGSPFREPVSGLLHKRGINIRHLGYLRMHVKSPSVRVTLLVEMVARSLKHILRAELRRVVRRWTLPSEYRMRQRIVHILNIFTGRSPMLSPALWRRVYAALTLRFGRVAVVGKVQFDVKTPEIMAGTGSASPVPLAAGDIKESELFNAIRPYLGRVLDLLGVDLTAECRARIDFRPGSVFRFNVPDLLPTKVRVRKMGILNFANAQLLGLVGRRELDKKNIPVACELFRLARNAFDRALKSNPADQAARAERAFVDAMVSCLGFGPRSHDAALDCAIYHGHETVVQMLVRKTQLLPERLDEALFWAVHRGWQRIVKDLIQKRADVNCTTPDHGAGPLTVALRRGHDAIALRLLRAGAIPDAPDQQGVTPLMASVRSEELYVKIAAALFERDKKRPAGARDAARAFEAKDAKLNSLLHHAAQYGRGVVLQRVVVHFETRGAKDVAMSGFVEEKSIVDVKASTGSGPRAAPAQIALSASEPRTVSEERVPTTPRDGRPDGLSVPAMSPPSPAGEEEPVESQIRKFRLKHMAASSDGGHSDKPRSNDELVMRRDAAVRVVPEEEEPVDEELGLDASNSFRALVGSAAHDRFLAKSTFSGLEPESCLVEVLLGANVEGLTPLQVAAAAGRHDNVHSLAAIFMNNIDILLDWSKPGQTERVKDSIKGALRAALSLERDGFARKGHIRNALVSLGIEFEVFDTIAGLTRSNSFADSESATPKKPPRRPMRVWSLLRFDSSRRMDARAAAKASGSVRGAGGREARKIPGGGALWGLAKTLRDPFYEAAMIGDIKSDNFKDGLRDIDVPTRGNRPQNQQEALLEIVPLAAKGLEQFGSRNSLYLKFYLRQRHSAGMSKLGKTSIPAHFLTSAQDTADKSSDSKAPAKEKSAFYYESAGRGDAGKGVFKMGRELRPHLGMSAPILVVQVWQRYRLGRNRPIGEVKVQLHYGALQPGRPVTHWWKVTEPESVLVSSKSARRSRSRSGAGGSTRSSPAGSGAATAGGLSTRRTRHATGTSTTDAIGSMTAAAIERAMQRMPSRLDDDDATRDARTGQKVLGKLRLRIRFDPGDRLLKMWGAVCQNRRQRAFRLAAQRGHRDVLRRLLRANVDVNNKAYGRNISATPLQIVAALDRPDLVGDLLEAKADVTQRDQYGCTALHTVARAGALKAAELALNAMKKRRGLVSVAAWVNEQDDHGRTPLHLCSETDDPRVARLFLQNLPDRLNLDAKDARQWTPLHVAASRGSAGMARVLLQHKATVDFKAERDATPLHLAVKSCDEETVEVLVVAKANLNARNSIGRTALFLAAEAGHAPILKLLLMSGADHSVKDMLQKRALDVAAEANDERIAEILLKVDPNSDVVVDIPTPFDLSQPIARARFHERALIRASCLEKDGNAVEQLLKAKADPNEEFQGRTALHCAVWTGNVSATRLLLSAGADVVAKMSGAETVISVAIVDERSRRPHSVGTRLGLVKLLLSHGASPDAVVDPTRGVTPLIHVCRSPAPSRALVRALIEGKAAVNRRDKEGGTALLSAAARGHGQIADLLLLYKADATLELNNKRRDNAFMLAAASGHIGVVEALLKRLGQQAAANTRNSNGSTPLMAAAAAGRAEVVSALIDAGASVNMRSNLQGDTALMRATIGRDLSIVRRLLKAKADINQRSTQGYTAVCWAVFLQNADMVRLLCREKADVNVRSYTDQQRTALRLASIKGSASVVRVLLEHKARPQAADRLAAEQAGHRGVIALLDSAMGNAKGWAPGKKLSHREISRLFGTSGQAGGSRARHARQLSISKSIGAIKPSLLLLDDKKSAGSDAIATPKLAAPSVLKLAE